MDDDAKTDSSPAVTAEQSLRILIESSPDGVLIDRGGQLVFVNRAALRTLGYREDRELFWRATSELIHPSDRERLEAATRGELPDGATSGTFELRMLRRTGHVVAVEASTISLVFEGNPATVYMIRDITERRRMEKQLQFADRMASVGTLAAGVAHEINTPLTYMLGNLDLIDDEIASRADQLGDDAAVELRQLLADAREGAFRVQTIVRELRTFARRPDVERVSDVDVQQILESVGKMAMHEIRHRARFVKEFHDTPPVRANPSHLNQVFLNLLINAAHAIPVGNVKDNEVRLVTGVDASGMVLVEVSDTGSGIGFDILDRIFDPFFTTKDPGVGTGLGLSICHGLVMAIGGEITVDSIVGEGTTFRVRLPTGAAPVGDSHDA